MKDIKNLLCITSILDNNSINKNLLFKIRSNYILARIFNHLNVHKKLEILHYNKCLQSTLDIKLIDYMNYSDSLRDIVILIEKGGTYERFEPFFQNFGIRLYCKLVFFPCCL